MVCRMESVNCSAEMSDRMETKSAVKNFILSNVLGISVIKMVLECGMA